MRQATWIANGALMDVNSAGFSDLELEEQAASIAAPIATQHASRIGPAAARATGFSGFIPVSRSVGWRQRIELHLDQGA
jgi:hypothetical protein